ncbi:hypothetical protein LUZ60_003596 [Juncus effusus]|nr:hypothetical protein LUZ60_003596 [Juncus effusus]
MAFSFGRLPNLLQLPRALRQIEQEIETVINVLKPGPVGIVEHKFSSQEINEAKIIVENAVQNWKRNKLVKKVQNY